MGVKSVLKVNICLILVIQSIYKVKIGQFWLVKSVLKVNICLILVIPSIQIFQVKILNSQGKILYIRLIFWIFRAKIWF